MYRLHLIKSKSGKVKTINSVEQPANILKGFEIMYFLLEFVAWLALPYKTAFTFEKHDLKSIQNLLGTTCITRHRNRLHLHGCMNGKSIFRMETEMQVLPWNRIGIICTQHALNFV